MLRVDRMLERPIKMEVDGKGKIVRVFAYGDISRAIRFVEPPEAGSQERLFTFKIKEEQVEIHINEAGD